MNVIIRNLTKCLFLSIITNNIIYQLTLIKNVDYNSRRLSKTSWATSEASKKDSHTITCIRFSTSCYSSTYTSTATKGYSQYLPAPTYSFDIRKEGPNHWHAIWLARRLLCGEVIVQNDCWDQSRPIYYRLYCAKKFRSQRKADWFVLKGTA